MAFIIPADPLTPRRLAGSVAPGARILRASEYAALGDAQALIAAAARQADGIVADARAAYEAERERGYADGRDQAQLKAAQHMLEAAGRTVEYFAGVESAVIDIVMQAVRKLIAGFDDRERVGAVVHGALSVVRNQKQVTLRMHPDDVPIAEERMNDWLAGFPRMGYVDVVADPRLAPGPASSKARSAWSRPAWSASWRRCGRPSSACWGAAYEAGSGAGNRRTARARVQLHHGNDGHGAAGYAGPACARPGDAGDRHDHQGGGAGRESGRGLLLRNPARTSK